jgi:H+/Cl- antiporter ClcA
MSVIRFLNNLNRFNKRKPGRCFLPAASVFGYVAKWLLLCMVTGVMAGVAAAGFLWLLNWVTAYRELYPWLLYLLPLAGLAVGLLYHYWGKAVAGGNNLVIGNVQQPASIIPFIMAPLVLLCTLITHLCGGSAGREGTAVQMAGALADQLSKPFRLSAADRSLLLIAAIAAGFSGVFGTPLAGAIFGLEVCMLGRIKYQAVFPAFMAALVAHLATQTLQVPHTHYAIPVVPALSAISLGAMLLAGIAFGGCAALFSKAMHYCSVWFVRYIKWPPLRPVWGAAILVVAFWAIGTNRYCGLGLPIIEAAFVQPLPYSDFILKMLFTILTLSAGFKGGEVTPLFFIGAALGNALSLILPLPVALLSGMGFVAVFAGATNTPIACIVMAMELFGAQTGVYAALACVVAYLFSGHSSIYTGQVIDVAKPTQLATDEGKTIKELL